jgi:basic amino acid/polyamine antiporter, APA family
MSKLARTLGQRDVTLLVIGSVIGSGIFLVPATVLKQVNGSVGLALLVWLAGGLLSLMGALTYGELTAANPHAGGLYVYIRDCFGRLPAFLYGWTLLFVIASGSVATLAVAFSAYLNQIVPLSPAAAKAASICMIAAVAVINVWGTRKSANLQNVTTLIKVIAILAMSAVLMLLGRGYSGSAASLLPAEISGSLVSGSGLAMIAVLWAYEGWQYATFSAGETINPQRTFPRAFLVGTAALIATYFVANIGYLAALGPERAAGSLSIAAASVEMIVSPTAAKLIALPILVSIFSAANSVKLTAPRVYYAMARDKLFFSRLADVHPKYGTPAVAVLAGSAWAAVLAATGSFEQLLNYVISIGWIFYGLAAACVFVYRRRENVNENAASDAIASANDRPYRVPGYPVTPILFVLSAAAIVLNSAIAKPVDIAKGIGIVALGVPVYFIWRRRGS